MSNITINTLPTASTIDGSADILPIYTASATATQGISRNTLLGLSSAPLGLTDTQTMTNKTLTSPTISSPTFSGTLIGTYTIGGTPTFPSSVVTLSGSQTLTNKTLTSPTINSPSITNATLSADTITGHTTSNSGTIYGISVSTANVSMSGTLAVTGATTLSSTLAVTGIITSNTHPVWQYLGYAQITSNATTTSSTAVSGLSVGVTVPAGVTKVRVTGFASATYDTGANGGASLAIWSGATVNTLTTQLALAEGYNSSHSANAFIPTTVLSITAPSAGSIYYTIQLVEVGGVGTATLQASSTAPAFILVECC